MKDTVHSRKGSRGHNRSAVLWRVLQSRRTSRSQIASDLGLTVGAVSRITQELISAGLLATVGAHAPEGKPGRRFVELAFATGGAYVIGVTLEATVQHMLVMDLSGHEVKRIQLRFPDLADTGGSVRWLVGEIERQIRACGIRRERVLGIGVTPVGVVDPQRGVVIDSPLRRWRNVEVGPLLREALGLPVRVDSMLNAVMLAEHAHGLSRDRKDVILVHTTLGIGASVLAGGRVNRGSEMQAGQIAHVRVSGSTQPCICGRRGCLTALASGHAVLAALGHPTTAGSNLEKRLVALTSALERATRGDEAVETAVHAAGRSLGRFIGASMALVAPELLLLGGKLGSHDSYVRGVQQGLKECESPAASPAILVTSMSGDKAAALMAVEDLVFAGPLDLELLKPAAARSRTATRRASSLS